MENSNKIEPTIWHCQATNHMCVTFIFSLLKDVHKDGGLVQPSSSGGQAAATDQSGKRIK